MPQRQFWTDQHATAWAVAVNLDPTKVNSPSSMAFTVLDQSRQVMECATLMVPPNVLHEAVSGLLHDAWDAWLFGDPGSMKATVKRVGQAWREEARLRPIW